MLLGRFYRQITVGKSYNLFIGDCAAVKPLIKI